MRFPMGYGISSTVHAKSNLRLLSPKSISFFHGLDEPDVRPHPHSQAPTRDATQSPPAAGQRL
jgi:hypothetical protein